MKAWNALRWYIWQVCLSVWLTWLVGTNLHANKYNRTAHATGPYSLILLVFMLMNHILFCSFVHCLFSSFASKKHCLLTISVFTALLHGPCSVTDGDTSRENPVYTTRIHDSHSRLAITKSYCRDFIANDEWPPSSPDLSPLTYQVWGDAGVLSQAATKVKNSSEFKDAIQLIWSVFPEKGRPYGGQCC